MSTSLKGEKTEKKTVLEMKVKSVDWLPSRQLVVETVRAQEKAVLLPGPDFYFVFFQV